MANAGTWEARVWEEHDKIGKSTIIENTFLVEYCINVALALKPGISTPEAADAGLCYARAFEAADKEESQDDYTYTKSYLVEFFSFIRPGLEAELGINRGNWWRAARSWQAGETEYMEVVREGLTYEYFLLFDIPEDDERVIKAVEFTMKAGMAHARKEWGLCENLMTQAYAQFE